MPKYIQLPDGGLFPLKEGENPQDAIAEAERLHPQAFGITKKEAPKASGSAAGDIFTALKQGAVGSTKALTDIFGADNAVSSYLGQKSQELQQKYSPAAQEEMRQQAERMKAAEASGSTLEEIKAAAQSIAEAPLRSAAQGAGSLIPYLPTMLLGPMAGALKLAPRTVAALEAISETAPKVLGTAQGVGAVKGSVYDAVYQNELEATGNEQVARNKAQAAQNYMGKNLDQMIVGGVLGRIAGGTGAERLLTKAGMSEAAEKLAPRLLRAAGEEFITEGPQGAQERLAQNLALQREGVNVPTMQGVVGQGLQEGLIGALSAGPVAGLRGPDVAARRKEEERKAAEAAAAAQQAELARYAQTEIGAAGMGETAAAPYFYQPQQALPGFESVEQPQVAAAPEAPIDLNRELRLITQRLDDLREQAKNTPNLQQKIALADQAEKLLAAQKELQTQISKMPKSADEQLKALQRQMAVAEENGDLVKQRELAQKMLELGAGAATEPEAQLEFPMRKFETKTESVDSFNQRVVGPEMAAAREAAEKNRIRIQNELSRLQNMGMNASDPEYARLAREERQTQLEIERIEQMANINQGVAEQGDLFGALGSTQYTGEAPTTQRTPTQIAADMTVARLAGNRQAYSDLAEEMRSARAKTTEAPTGPTVQNLQGQLPMVPKAVEQQQAAADKRAAGFAEMVRLVSQYNRGAAKIDDLEAARKNVVDGLIEDAEATRGRPLEGFEREQLEREANGLLGDLVRRFGDTRNLTQKGTAARPLLVPAQDAQGRFTAGEAPDTGFPTVESAAAGYRTFGNPYAAAMSIKEGLDQLRNKAVGVLQQPLFAQQFTPESTTPAVLRGELDRALAKGPRAFTQGEFNTLTQIADNLPVIQSSPDKEQRGIIGQWLYRLNTGNLGSADPINRDVQDVLARMEAAKRSDEVVQGEFELTREVGKPGPSTGQERGKVFGSAMEFYKYLASDALQQLRSDIGLARPTLARLEQRLAPFMAKAEKLRADADKYQQEYARLRQLREAQFDELQDMNAQEIKRENEQILAAKQLVEETEAALKDVTDRLDAELNGFVIDYMEARSAFEFAVKTSEDISKAIDANVLRFNASVAKASVDLAQAKDDLAGFMAFTRKNLSFSAEERKDKFLAALRETPTNSYLQSVIQERGLTGVLFLQERVVQATRDMQRALALTNTEPRIKAFLERDLDLQMQLAEEAAGLDRLTQNMIDANLALDLAKRQQQNSRKNKAEIKAATEQVSAAKEMLADEQRKANERAALVDQMERDLGFERVTIAHRISETQSSLVTSVRTATDTEKALQKQMDPLLDEAKKLETGAAAALRAFTTRRDRLAAAKQETQADREERDRQQRRLELEALDRLAAMPGERISFEKRRQVFDAVQATDEAILDLDSRITEAQETLDTLTAASGKLDDNLKDVNAQIVRLEKLTAVEPRTFKNKLMKNSRLVELEGLRSQRDQMLKKQEQVQKGLAVIKTEIVKAESTMGALLIEHDEVTNLFSNEPEISKPLTEWYDKMIERVEKNIGKVQQRLAEKQTKALRTSRLNDLSKYKRQLAKYKTKRDARRGIERTALPLEQLTTEPVEAGDRLPARKIGPVVKAAVQAGNVRTGEASTAEERKVSPKNKIKQAGQPRTETPTQAIRAANKGAAAISPATMMEAKKQLSFVSRRRDELKEDYDAAVEAGDEALAAKLDAQYNTASKEVSRLKKIVAATPNASVNVYTGEQFSRGLVENGMTSAELQAELDRAVGGPNITQRKVRVFDSVADFYDKDPNARYDYPDIPADAKAFVDPETNSAVMFANNIGKGDGLGVLLHEVGVHIGFRNLFNASQYNTLVNAVKNWAKRKDGSVEAQVAQRAIERVEAAGTSAEQYDDELLAYTVEEAVKAGVLPTATKNGSALRNWLNTVLSQLKKALEQFGLVTKNLTAGDLVNMAYGAAQLEVRGTWHGSDAVFTAFDTKYAGAGEGKFDRRFDTDNLGVGPYVTPDRAYAEYYQHAIPFGKAANKAGYGNMSYQDYRDMDDLFMVRGNDELSDAQLARKYESLLLTQYLNNVSRGGELDPNKNTAVQRFLQSTPSDPRVAAAMQKLSIDKIKPLTERPAKGNLYRTLDDVPAEKIYNINSTVQVGERPKIDALYKKYGGTFLTKKDGTKVDIDLDNGKYPLNSLFFRMRDKVGIEETTRLLKAAGIDAIERVNDRRYVERAYIDNAPQILAVNLNPVGPAKGLLFSKNAPQSLQSLADDLLAKPKTFRERLGDNAKLEAEMQLVDMRAGLREALKSGDPELYKQAMYNVLKADQKMAMVYTTLNNGPLEMYTDEKGMRGIRSTGKDSAIPVFKAIADLPIGDKNAKVNVATAYLIAQRGLNKGAERFGMTEDRLRQIMRDVDANPELKTALNKVRDAYNAYNEGQIRFLASTGAIPKNVADDLLASGDYVPFYRVRNDGTAELVYGDGITVAIGDIRSQPYLAELKGGEDKILPLNESLYRNTLLLTSKALTNLAVKSTAYGLQAIGKGKGPIDPNTGQPRNLMAIHKGAGPAGNDVIRFNQEPDPNDDKDDGRRWVKIETKGTVAEDVPAALVVRSMEGAHLPLPAFLKVAGAFSDVLRSGVTRMPPYIIKQLIRDPMSASFTGGLNYGPLRAVAKASKEFVSQYTGGSQSAAKLIEKGLIQSNIFAGDESDISKMALQLASGDGQNALEKVFAFMDKAAIRADAATRALVYENALKNGLSEVEADMMTMESMNFYKRGLNPMVQYGNRLIPFLNAQIQGLNVLFKAARGNMPFEEQQKIKAKFYRNATFLFGLGLVYAMAMDDDEYFRNARPRDKYSNFFLHLPGVEEPVKIPTPFEAGYFFSAAVAMVDAMKAETNTQEQWQALRDMFLNSVPGWSSRGVPQIVKPVFEVWTNKNFLSGAPIESARMQAKDITERTNANTSEFAKQLSKAVPILSPVQIEHIARGYLGQAPLALLGMTNAVLTPGTTGEAPEKRAHENVLFGSMFQKKYGGADTDYMFRMAKESIEARNTLNDLRKQGRAEDAREYLVENKAKIALASAAGAYREASGRINTDIERTRNRKDLSGAEKTARIEQLEKAKQDLADKFSVRFNRVLEAS